MHYERQITFCPEGGGPCEAASVPSHSEKRILSVRSDTLQASLVPARGDTIEEAKIGAAASRMLRGYTALRNSDTTSLVVGLTLDLNKFPAWAVVKVLEKVHDGEYPSLNPAYAPNVPQLCQFIRLELAAVKIEQQRIDMLLALVPRESTLTPLQREQRAQSAEAWLKRVDPRAAKLVANDDDEAAQRGREFLAASTRLGFERTCIAGGIDPASGVMASPALLATLNLPKRVEPAEDSDV